VREIINDAIGRAINTSGDACCRSIYQAWRNLKAWRDLRLPPLRDRVPSKYSPKYGRAGVELLPAVQPPSYAEPAANADISAPAPALAAVFA